MVDMCSLSAMNTLALQIQVLINELILAPQPQPAGLLHAPGMLWLGLYLMIIIT